MKKKIDDCKHGILKWGAKILYLNTEHYICIRRNMRKEKVLNSFNNKQDKLCHHVTI